MKNGMRFLYDSYDFILKMSTNEIKNITGIPIIINTSFNLRGEPIVCTPEDAIDFFQRSKMDCLVLGNYVIERLGN